MYEAHKNMGLTNLHFDAIKELITTTLKVRDFDL